ncbi:cell wall synthesis protein CwsA [Mycobacterium sp. M26]
MFGGLGLATVVGGAVAFSIVRRSMQPEPSALPPSVEVAPKP